jgi:hypothetical protein
MTKLQAFLQHIRDNPVVITPDDYDALHAQKLRDEFKANYPEIESYLEELRQKAYTSCRVSASDS